MASMASVEFLTFLDEHSAKYFEAMKLMNHDAKQDPVSAPYQSLYQAREILNALLEKLKSLSDHCKNSACQRALAVLHLKLGINHVESDESSAGEEHFKQCKIIIDGCELDTVKSTGINQELLNQFGLLHSQRNNLDKGLECLTEAKVLYQSFKNDSGGSCPWSADNFFQKEAYNNEQNEEREKKRIGNFEDSFTHTLYFMAQVYGKLSMVYESAEYCKETLKRQLSRHNYEALEWSMNAATLSQFYVTNNEYSIARHCLSSAELILKEFGEKPASLHVSVNDDDSQETVNKKEKLPKSWADLFRCWIKYALSLLEYSIDRLARNAEDKELNRVPQEIQTDDLEKEPFDLELASVENQISADPILIFDQAREVYLQCQSWIQSAKDFYVLDGHCSDHVELVRDHSRLFKFLAFFELDLQRQCQMHKRRADMLSSVLNELNPQYYLSACYQLSFEVGEIYSTMLDNKLTILESEEEISKPKLGHAAKKINLLANKGIEYFQLYLKYLRTPQGVLPSKFQEDSERTALMAQFYCGRLYSKLLTDDPEEKLHNTKMSFESYSYLVNYCNSNPSALEKVKEEKDACQEMVGLLPAKMDRIRAQMNT